MNDTSIVELAAPPLPYYLGSGCSEFQIGDYHPNRKNLGIYDLLIVAKGALSIGENGQEWTLHKGDTLLLLPEGEHYSPKPCETETVFYWVHFEHTKQHKPMTEIQDNEPLYLTQPFGNPHTLRLLKHVRLSRPEPVFERLSQLSNLPLDNVFWQEQIVLAELLALLEEGNVMRPSSGATRLAEQVAAYIQAHYKEKITAQALTAAFHFHPNYIVRCMKAHYGRTPSDYLQDYRLERAKRLLVATEWSIERIAEEVGFRYAPYFSACFKQAVGSSPLRFRNQFRGGRSLPE
jgi:AraC-like DNA-binding protein